MLTIFEQETNCWDDLIRERSAVFITVSQFCFVFLLHYYEFIQGKAVVKNKHLKKSHNMVISFKVFHFIFKCVAQAHTAPPSRRDHQRWYRQYRP